MDIEYKILKKEEIESLNRDNNVLFHGTNYQSLTASPEEIRRMFEASTYIKDYVFNYLREHRLEKRVRDFIQSEDALMIIDNEQMSEYGFFYSTYNLAVAYHYCDDNFGWIGFLAEIAINAMKELELEFDDDRLYRYIFYYQNHIERYKKAQKVIIVFEDVDDKDLLSIGKDYMIKNDDCRYSGKAILEKDFKTMIDALATPKEKRLIEKEYLSNIQKDKEL